MNPTSLFYVNRYYTKNFAETKTNAVYTLHTVKKIDVEDHWFIKTGEFNVKLLCDGKVRYYYLTEDKGHAVSTKSALYFKIQKNDGDVIPVFLGFSSDTGDSNGLGLYLGGKYPSEKMGSKFDYGTFAQNFYVQINESRKDYKDYKQFAPWVMKHLDKIIKDALKEQQIDYDMDSFDKWDFVHIRGTESIGFIAGLFSNENGKQFLDTDILLEIIGYRIFAAKKNLYKFTLDQDFIANAYEKALKYIEESKFGSVKDVPAKGINSDNIEVYNIAPHQTVELGSGPQSAVSIRLDGLPQVWTKHFMEPNYKGDTTNE
ncbi:MAG: hypothetical protein MJZ34_02765 [Paludibacteraceae bacterium]|nr:hypothetical protein [Paludibacteraceae bacterium]